MIRLHSRFPLYTRFSPQAPVWCVTPDRGATIHRFFDTPPFSPSGRYLALFRMPYENRLPQPGDCGQVLLIDLEAGTERVVAETRGWEPQLGAQVQWGWDDRVLLFNDVDVGDWKAYGVRLDPFSGKRERLEGTVYSVSPDGRKAVSADLTAMRRTQAGYGVVIPDERVPRNKGLREEDGFHITDLENGKRRLLISIASVAKRMGATSEFANRKERETYGFHCKWNPQGTRLLFSTRAVLMPKRHPFNVHHKSEKLIRYDVFTIKEDGSELYLAVPASQWEKGGHHTHWFPDGEWLSMNLNIEGKGLCFVQTRYDGTGTRKILDDIPGSGHPSIHPRNRYMLTDAYPLDRVAYWDATIPIRLIDMVEKTERAVVRIRTAAIRHAFCPALRVDPHPAWDRQYKWIAFNGLPDGTRRVFVADLSQWV